MRIVNLGGLIGRDICLLNCKGDTMPTVYECVGYGTDPDTENPTAFLLNKSTNSVFERDMGRIVVKGEV